MHVHTKTIDPNSDISTIQLAVYLPAWIKNRLQKWREREGEREAQQKKV